MIPAAEVAEVSNKIYDLVTEAEVTPNRFERDRRRAEALMRSCEFLGAVTIGKNDRSLADNYAGALRQAERSMSVERHFEDAAQHALALVSEDWDHFQHFLDLEYRLLTQSGLEPSFARWLISTIRETIHEIKTERASPEELLYSLRALERHVCDRSVRLLASVERWHTGRTLLAGFGGLTLVAANLAATGVLTPVGVGASAATGTALLGQSARRLLEG